MADSWPTCKLGQIAAVRHGWPFKSELYSLERQGRPIVVSIGNFQYSGGFRFESTVIKEYAGAYPHEYELNSGDLLLVMTCQTPGGEILGIPARVPSDGCTYLHNQRIGLVTNVAKHVDAGFLYWLFLTKSFNSHLVATASGTKILHTAPSRIEAFEFSLPPLPEQRAIAHILGTLDDKIELNRRTNETLEAMARALFKSWFVDFDPVHAKKAGRKPEGMDAETAALFPDDFEDSEMGKIPRGWRAVPLDTIADFLNGLALQKFPAAAGEPSLPVIKIAQLRKGAVDGADQANRNVPMQYVVKDGDLLFSWSGTLEVAVWCGGEGALNQHLFKVTSKSTPPWFYHGWLVHHLAEFRQIAADKATTMGHIQRGHLTRAIVALPSGKAIEVGSAALAPLAARSLSVRKNSQTLAALRDALLPQLLSGSLRVPEAMRLVEKAI